MLTKTALLMVALLATAALALDAGCHNFTGTCLHHGFVCANGEVVKHEKRCDGVDDCADATDEFMCEHADPTPLHERTHEARHAFAQASCVNCNCEVNVQQISTGNPWWNFAINAPTDPKGLMTGSPSNYGGQPCNHKCTTSLRLAFYKKNNVCRGYLCCARQRECMICSSGGQCPASNNPGWTTRCYRA